MSIPFRWMWGGLLLLLVQCTPQGPRRMPVRISVPGITSARSVNAKSVPLSALNCVFVNIVPQVYAGFSTCWVPGTLSQLAMRDASGAPLTIGMDAPLGPQQSIEVLGFASNAATPCTGSPSLTYPSAPLYRYGHATNDIYAGATIDIYTDASSGADVIPLCNISSHQFAYAIPNASYSQGALITPNSPLTSGMGLGSYSITPPLPNGLSLDPNSGVIGGTPQVGSPATSYTVSALGPLGQVFSSSLEISVTTLPFSFSWPQTPTSITSLQMQGYQILVGGSLGAGSPNLIRINRDGSLDTGFNAGGTGFNAAVSAIGVQSTGKIVVGGSFTTFNGSSVSSVVRLTPSGSFDLSFSSSPPVTSLAVGLDDNIFTAGYSGSPAYVLFNNANGSSFIPAGTTDQPTTVATRPGDGDFMIGTVFGAGNPTLHLDTSTGLAVSAGVFSTTLTAQTNSIAFQSNGDAIVASGSSVYRVLTSGALDASFSASVSGATLVALQSTGKILVASGGSLSRLNANGSTDASFVFPTSLTVAGTNYPITSISQLVVQPDDEIMASGTVGGGVIFLARFLSNGAVNN